MTKVTIEEENKNLKFLLEKAKQEIAEWKEKEFRACSKHHEFIDEIERLEKEIEEYRKLNRETNMEIGRHSQIVLNLAELNKALSKELESLANKMLNGECENGRNSKVEGK